MLGRFLELSLHSADVLAAVRFYQRLGLRELSTGDVWSHPYAVLCDGRLFLGLHGYRFDSPAVTFVLPSLAQRLELFGEMGIHLAFAKTGGDEFNEAGFLSPAGQMVAMLEARTFSPPPFNDSDFSLLGRFEELMVPADDQPLERWFWERLGFETTREQEQPRLGCTLAQGDLCVGTYRAVAGEPRALRFTCANPGPLALALDDADVEWHTLTPGPTGGEAALSFRGPDGLAFIVETP